jgi:hypothetical protein
MGASPKSLVAIVLLCGLVGLGPVVLAQRGAGATDKGPAKTDAETAKLMAQLRQLIDANLKATRAEDVDGVVATIHTKSPAYRVAKLMNQRLFATYDFQHELMSVGYVGRDKDYAVLRVRQKTVKVRGPAFRDNIVDTMQIFRKDGAKWKLWQSVVLETAFLAGR